MKYNIKPIPLHSTAFATFNEIPTSMKGYLNSEKMSQKFHINYFFINRALTLESAAFPKNEQTCLISAEAASMT